MTAPLPIHVAASGFEMLVWLVVAAIWLIFQGLASAAKRKQPPDVPPPTLRRTLSAPEREPTEDLRDLIETITGQKPPLAAAEDEDEEEEPPAMPRPMARPEPVRKVILPPPRAVHVQQRTVVPSPRPAQAAQHVAPPLAPQAAATLVGGLDSHLIFAQAAMTSESLRLAPLLRMKWPRSQFQRLSGAARRISNATQLKRQLVGHMALRQAMISRIVLGPPGGR